jgi:hypothetical protein
MLTACMYAQNASWLLQRWLQQRWPPASAVEIAAATPESDPWNSSLNGTLLYLISIVAPIYR